MRDKQLRLLEVGSEGLYEKFLNAPPGLPTVADTTRNALSIQRQTHRATSWKWGTQAGASDCWRHRCRIAGRTVA